MEIYLDDFISLIHRWAAERTQMLRNLFHTIDCVLHPNKTADVNCKYPIYLKKFQKGDAACLKKKNPRMGH